MWQVTIEFSKVPWVELVVEITCSNTIFMEPIDTTITQVFFQDIL